MQQGGRNMENETLNTIYSRRSVRSFTGDAASRETLTKTNSRREIFIGKGGNIQGRPLPAIFECHNIMQIFDR